LAITAIVLTLQEYYGGRSFYNGSLRPWLAGLEARGSGWVSLEKYNELYGYVWWVAARVIGYVAIPFPLWKLLFPKDSLLDLGLRIRGLLQHTWIYALCLAVVVPLVFAVAQQSDFASYYPFYKNCSRSWFDLGIWQGIYWFQFLALEMFFRGWMVGALRHTMGAGAIFAMAVPYCMIHYGKPYLEAHAAVVAGIVLGSLAIRTRSIYAGCLVHITVAFLMDLLALLKRGALPTELWPPG
jgi:membrane protease YdiL (CAAX protease family)